MDLILKNENHNSKIFNFWLTNFVSSSTKKTYTSALNTFLTFIKPYKVNSIHDITSKMIIDYRDSLISRGLANKTVNLYISSLSSIFQEYVFNQILSSNPCDRVKRLPEMTKKIKFFLNDEEIFKLENSFKSSQDYLKLAFLLMVNTAQRGTSILSLRKKDIIEHDLNFVMKLKIKRSKSVLIPIPPALNELLLSILNKKSSEEFLFIGRDVIENKPISLKAFNKMLLVKARHSGIKKRVSSHCLRRSTLSKMVNSGFSPLLIMKSVSHHQHLSTLLNYHQAQEIDFNQNPILLLNRGKNI